MIDVLGVVTFWAAAAIAEEWDKKHMLGGTNISHMPAQGDTGYTILLEQHGQDYGENTTNQCIGVVLNEENIITSESCIFGVSDPVDDEGNQILKLKHDPNKLPMSVQVLTVDTLALPDSFTPPSIIDEKSEFDDLMNTDDFGLVIAVKGPKMGLVRWNEHNKAAGGTGRSECGNNYKEIRRLGWPAELPGSIFCVGKGKPTDNYVMEVMGDNVTIVAGLPCDDSLGSPLIVPDRGVMGIVTYANCTAGLVYVHSLAHPTEVPDSMTRPTKTNEESIEDIIVTRKLSMTVSVRQLTSRNKTRRSIVKNTGRRACTGYRILSAAVFGRLVLPINQGCP